MAYIIYIGKPKAYVSPEKTVIECKTAALIEPCLAAYGVKINLAYVEKVRTQKGVLVGFTATDTENRGPDYVVKAIQHCIEFVAGIKINIEKEEQLYEVKVEKGVTGEAEEKTVEGGEIEFETV